MTGEILNSQEELFNQVYHKIIRRLFQKERKKRKFHPNEKENFLTVKIIIQEKSSKKSDESPSLGVF